MKRIITLVLAMVVLFTLASCGGDTTVSNGEKTVSVGTIEELQEVMANDVVDTAEGLRAEYDMLMAEIDTYDKYIKNVDKVEAFYNKVNEETKAICIRMREYSISYTEIVMDSNDTNEEKYDTIGDLYDCIYEDACGDIYDSIYEDLLGDMYDSIYGGVVRDGYEYAQYEEWSDASSAAYDMWSDSLSDVYDEWSDALSDIYDYWSDVYGDIYGGDEQGVREETAKFREEIGGLKAEEESVN